MAEYLETGEVVTTHGIHGELKIYPWADSPDFLLQFRSLRIGATDYKVASSRVQGTCVLVKLKEIDTVEAASALIHSTVYFDRTGITPESGYFIADLIGLDVRCEGESIGTLKEVLQYPGNDVWVVRGKREYLIPSVPSFILGVHIPEGYAEVRLLEGMASDEN